MRGAIVGSGIAGLAAAHALAGPHDVVLYEAVVPLAAALWSLAPDHCGAFPAVTYLRFLDQHGMLSPFRPMRWHTVVGGSSRYVDALLARLRATGRFTLRLATPVISIARDAGGVTLVANEGERQRFDRVIVATHANTALSLLAEPTAAERRVLGAFRYSENRTVLHSDRVDFWFDAPLDGDALAIEMHVHHGEARAFTARATRSPLSDRSLAAAALRYPLMTLQVIGLIHFEALKHRLAGVPYYRPGQDHRPFDLPPR